MVSAILDLTLTGLRNPWSVTEDGVCVQTATPCGTTPPVVVVSSYALDAAAELTPEPESEGGEPPSVRARAGEGLGGHSYRSAGVLESVDSEITLSSAGTLSAGSMGSEITIASAAVL